MGCTTDLDTYMYVYANKNVMFALPCVFLLTYIHLIKVEKYEPGKTTDKKGIQKRQKIGHIMYSFIMQFYYLIDAT